MSQPALLSKMRPSQTDAGYATARLRGMRSHLLKGDFYERLIAAPDMLSAFNELMATGYEADLEAQLVHGRTAESADVALKNNMIRAYRKVLSFLDPTARELLATLLGRWDVFNIKTVLRGAHSHVEFREVQESLLPAGFLGEVELEGLARLDEVRAIIDTMATWGLEYASSLREAFPEYARTGDLAALELALDREYAEWAAARLTGERADVEVTRKMLSAQIDVLNLVTVFRAIKDGTGSDAAQRYFLRGSRGIHRELFSELCALSDVDDVLDRLKHTPYGGTLDSAAVHYLENQSIPVFERALEELLMRKALTSGVRDPHGVGVAIAYLWAKQNEVTNVRIIVRGKAVGMPAERVRRELILV